MEATIWVKEINDYVIFNGREEWQDDGFSCANLRSRNLPVDDPELTFHDITWDESLYTQEQNAAIKGYLHMAESQLITNYYHK